MKKLLILALLLYVSPALAASSSLSLTVDHGTSLTLSGPASSVFIANPDIADVQVMSPTQVMIFGKRTGETTFMATDARGHTLAQRTVTVTQDMSELRNELNAAIPGNTIKATPVPNGIVLTGMAKDPAAVADAYKIAMRFMPTGGDIINRVQVNGSNQISIHVRFAEVQRNVDNTLGFDLQNALTIGGGMVVGLATGNGVNAITTATSGTIFDQNELNGLFPRPNNSTLNTPNDVLGANYTGKHITAGAMIDALAQEGMINILAEPTLTAMSGETANFLAGGEFPIPIPQGNGTISITFKSYGISLEFTPTLLSGNRISLHVRPEVSQLTTAGSIILNNITVPALTTRKAETTVEVGSGQSFAIAGLMDNSQAQTVDKFPLLGDMPILGALFRSEHFQSGQTELMVIITPYVVKPSTGQLALPTDGMAPPNETEMLVGLRKTSSDPNARPMSGDPVGVAAPTPTLAPVPAAAPLVPVTNAPDVSTTDIVMPPVAATPALVETPLAPAPIVSVPSEPAPAPTVPTPSASSVAPPVLPAAVSPPVVLHPVGDMDKHSGGILVE